MLSYVLTSNNRGVKTRLKMNVFFWKSIENEVGNVLPHIKNTLELEGLAGNAALGKLDLEDIKSMEQQMRFRVERIRRIVDSDATKSLEDFYGDYAGQPDLFKFTAGDIRVLQTLAAAVKRNGLNMYFYSSLTDATRCVAMPVLLTSIGLETTFCGFRGRTASAVNCLGVL